MFPGPLVEANTGDRIVVKVTNNIVNGTAIHWHGMFQNGNHEQ
jgi:iron transport multicopper oxidase